MGSCPGLKILNLGNLKRAGFDTNGAEFDEMDSCERETSPADDCLSSSMAKTSFPVAIFSFRTLISAERFLASAEERLPENWTKRIAAERSSRSASAIHESNSSGSLSWVELLSEMMDSSSRALSSGEREVDGNASDGAKSEGTVSAILENFWKMYPLYPSKVGRQVSQVRFREFLFFVFFVPFCFSLLFCIFVPF